MNWYKYIANIKIGLFIFGLILISAFVIFIQEIVNNLREDNREIVRIYAEIVAGVVDEESNENLNFIFENIIQKVRFPLILSDGEKQPLSWRNLPQKIAEQDTLKVIEFREKLDQQNSPFPLIYDNPITGDKLTYGFLHFGDSVLINRLEWLPFLQIGLVGLFILLGFAGFSVIRNSEKRHIWSGMARETAHQLGTPVSALMGWIDLLKKSPEKSETIIKEIEIDLERLQEISDRFGDMGKTPQFEQINLVNEIENVINYLRQRVPATDIQFNFDTSNKYLINGNRKLLSWAIENIVKNGIDASTDVSGKISLDLSVKGNNYILDITDFGKGVPKKDWKNVFRPGFSTKKYGWGLGLSLVNRIIDDFHNGKVYVHKSEVDNGTTFRIILK